MTEANLDIRGTVLHKHVQILAVAYDVVIEIKTQLELHFTGFKMVGQENGSVINYDKEKCIENSTSTKENYIKKIEI